MNEEIVSNSKIVSAYELDDSMLHGFYKKYPINLGNGIAHRWKWSYNTSFHDNQIPLVMVYKNKIIAHAGMIPFKVSINSEQYNATWFVNIFLLPEFQRQGLGGILTKKWTEFSYLCVIFCNNMR